MATEKWNRLNAIGRVCGLPTLHIDTAVISLLNNINESVPEKEFVEFEKLLEQPNSEGSLDWLQGKLDNVVANQDSYVNKINIIKRVQRNTLLSRIVEKHTSLVYWPDAAKEYAKSHVLSPLVLEFAPVMALGLLENGKKVFVYMRVINDDEAFVVDQRLKNNIDHYLIFLAHPLNKQKMEIIFDGPAKKLTWEKFQNENSENKKKNEFSAIEICLLNKDVDSEEKIKRRTDDAEKKPVVLDF
jgi:hypothetical protein